MYFNAYLHCLATCWLQTVLKSIVDSPVVHIVKQPNREQGYLYSPHNKIVNKHTTGTARWVRTSLYSLSSCLPFSDEYRGGVRQRALSVSKACWERPYSHLPHSRMHMHKNPLHFKTTFPFSLLWYSRWGREWSLRSSDEACPLVYLCWGWWPQLRLWEMPWPRALWIL